MGSEESVEVANAIAGIVGSSVDHRLHVSRMLEEHVMWMEVAVVATIFAVGNILFGHWEEQTPKWRRLLKFALIVGLTLAISTGLGRVWAWGFLGLLGAAVVIVHAWWLPRQGINGWTAEPKEKYYAMRGWKYPPAR